MMQTLQQGMPLRDALEKVKVLGRSGPDNPDILGITCDSRLVRPGWLYVAIRGHSQDGVRFADDAVRRGAAALMAEERLNLAPPVAMVHVADARAALAGTALKFFGDPAASLLLIGATGTNGKTTVAFMCSAILKAAGKNPGLIGTVRYEIGGRSIPASRTTPDAAEIQQMLSSMLKAGCRSAVMEVSSHALDQRRTEGLEFDAAVFTNLSQDHLDYHKDFESYFSAKKKLFESLAAGRKKGVAVVNRACPWGTRLCNEIGGRSRLVTFGTMDSDVRAGNIQADREGSVFHMDSPWGNREMRIRLPGRFNVSNALAATAACGAVGVDLNTIRSALENFETAPGRLERIANRHGFSVFVDYAHTPDALQNVLATLRELTDKKLIAVFGCGGDRDRTKRPLMGAAVTGAADAAVITSDNPRTEDPLAIIREIEAGCAGRKYEVEPDRRKAISMALAMARPGDIVLIAGKGHETYQEFGKTMTPFDDRQVARELLGEEQPS
ncbi:MAG: UDP-N-acetylmuramoyl-L-alanyl-D-glutamate--2,6-diaminopimelate ligase [Kiritimatiellia bacterium]